MCVARHRGLRLESRFALVLKAHRRSLLARALGFGDSCVFLPALGAKESGKLGSSASLGSNSSFLPVPLSYKACRALSFWERVLAGQPIVVSSPLWAPKRGKRLWSTTWNDSAPRAAFPSFYRCLLFSLRERKLARLPAGFCFSGAAMGLLRLFCLPRSSATPVKWIEAHFGSCAIYLCGE